jgi:hypothetical protein
MKNCTDEQLARAFLLGALRDGPATVEGIMRAGDQHGLDDGLLSEAAAGLAVTKFKHRGEWCWQLPPNVLPFVVRAKRQHARRFSGNAHGGSAA